MEDPSAANCAKEEKYPRKTENGGGKEGSGVKKNRRMSGGTATPMDLEKGGYRASHGNVR